MTTTTTIGPTKERALDQANRLLDKIQQEARIAEYWGTDASRASGPTGALMQLCVDFRQIVSRFSLSCPAAVHDLTAISQRVSSLVSELREEERRIEHLEGYKTYGCRTIAAVADSLDRAMPSYSRAA